ncbi:RNA-binding protein 40 [Orussus abietinus]|uniref:RNA-binding protein 40 n=1 Tax=Orussus abietinus TaxID=222816 RepID=UPI0006263127|nr:RNA-binding protein 40 [Orussus abietinus]
MSSQMAGDTLRVLHLPAHLSDSQRDVLLKKYGATKTRTVRKSDKYAATFAAFPSKHAATEAFLRLHQLQVKGRYLSVEFAKQSIPSDSSAELLEAVGAGKDGAKDSSHTEHLQAFLKQLNSWTGNHVFTQPPSPNVCYKYPSPTKNTLLRIAIQLLKEPAFYTQVLHLMNRMNLPPPFEELEGEFPMLAEAYDMERYKNIFGIRRTGKDDGREDEDEEEEESELESEEEQDRPVEVIPAKRKRLQPTKRLKIPKFVNPAKQKISTASQRPVRPEDVFEPVQHDEAKNVKIEMKLSETVMNSAETIPESRMEVESGFGLMFPAKRDEEEESMPRVSDDDSEVQECITSEQLASNRISANDQRLLPVFKNYHAGKPSCRLYIKNLAKQVEPKDLDFIYRKYLLPSSEKFESEFNVRLMQEGRMKGQAFVTLQNLEQAHLALEETNGYILKDKPMVVQFAKAPKS